MLVVTGGAAHGRQFDVEDELVLGRAVSGDGRLTDDNELSRRHARISRGDTGQLAIEDLGSANGTYVNGQRISSRVMLTPGDSVKLGSTTIDVTDAASAALAASAPPAAPVARPEPPPAPVARPEPPPAPVARPEPPPPPPPVARPEPPPPPTARPPEPLVPPPPPPTPQRAAPPRPPAVPTADLVSNLPPGTVFAGCRVEDIIGHGDMGVVYRAEELALQRLVALKLILPGQSEDARVRERFRRESKVAAAIDHQNVIPIFDAGEEQGVMYIMMRLVDGVDLRAVIESEGALAPARAARIVRQVGAALDAAHAHGILHRDVKPSNVMLARRDHAYLTDFGLAKPESSIDALTRHGTVVARVDYIAPEQLLGQDVDARADIYALGCVLFEALTGVEPFQRAVAEAGLLARLEAAPPMPSSVRPDLPRAFDEVVARAMARDPAERYPSGGDLGEAALVAAGALRRARPLSMVATGEAAFAQQGVAAARSPAEPAAAAASARAGRAGGASGTRQAPRLQVTKPRRRPVHCGGRSPSLGSCSSRSAWSPRCTGSRRSDHRAGSFASRGVAQRQWIVAITAPQPDGRKQATRVRTVSAPPRGDPAGGDVAARELSAKCPLRWDAGLSAALPVVEVAYVMLGMFTQHRLRAHPP